MSYVASRSTRPKGFSLIEAIVVVAITLILAALTSKAMFSALYVYRVGSSARQLSSLAQVSRIKAMARNQRYRLAISTTSPNANSYRVERYNSTTSAWEPDPGNGWVKLAPGVTFNLATPVSLATAPPNMGTSPAQASDMTFNTRGLLANGSALVNSGCFYVQGRTKPPYAICTTLPGATSTWRFVNSNWEKVF